MSKFIDRLLCYLLFSIKKDPKQIHQTYHLNEVKNQTYGTEINGSTYHDELYLFNTLLSI